MAAQSPTTTAARSVPRPGTTRFRPAPLLLITSPAGYVLLVAVTLHDGLGPTLASVFQRVGPGVPPGAGDDGQ